jgi:fucose 4-O-acetylase-like acetyltransferase
VVAKVVTILGRASLIIFILAGTIFVSMISLGECAPFDLHLSYIYIKAKFWLREYVEL